MKKIKILFSVTLLVCMIISMVGCSSDAGGAASEVKQSSASNGDEQVTLTIFGWETFQKKGMEAMAAKYMEDHPNVKIEVDISNWGEYWTKLEAMANSGTLPDIFWMHTNEFSRYAEAGKLADLTNLYDDVEENYYLNHFRDSLVENASYDNKIYGVPKDWDTIGLTYNKDIFDEAGLDYPDENWTWDTLVEASNTIVEKTGKYGMMAGLNEQEGFLNLIYQAGGYYLNEDKTESGMMDEGTLLGLKTWIGWNTENNFSPSQAELSELGDYERFAAGEGAMRYTGSWGINNLYINYPDLNWDVAVLPKCPNPISGDGRASIYNGLSYATAAENEHLDIAKDFLKFLGTEEANILQGENGAAIPAYIGTADSWSNNFENKNVKAYTEMMEYGIQFPYSKSKVEWFPIVEAELLEVYSGIKSLEKACKVAEESMNELLAKE